MKTKIQIKSILGKILFEFEKENNTIKDTVEEAVRQNANLGNANLRYANLRYANLGNADLRYANLGNANLGNADLRYANLRYANLGNANLGNADLRYADLRYANLGNANLGNAENINSCYLPLYSKWLFSFKGDVLIIGCKSKKISEWNDWFNSDDEFETKRGSEDFKRLHAMFLAHKAYYEFLNK